MFLGLLQFSADSLNVLFCKISMAYSKLPVSRKYIILQRRQRVKCLNFKWKRINLPWETFSFVQMSSVHWKKRRRKSKRELPTKWKKKGRILIHVKSHLENMKANFFPSTIFFHFLFLVLLFKMGEKHFTRDYFVSCSL